MAEEKVKERKITRKDWKKVEEFVNEEFQSRKESDFRKENEGRWKEVDRQIAMNPMKRISTDGKDLGTSWHSAFELGELSKASEIITADVMRITFPQDRKWFDPHIEQPGKIMTNVGQVIGDKSQESIQSSADGILRSLMAQQHLDFGFKARLELSVKEALHHGSYVSVVRFQKERISKDGKIGFLGAPVWNPYSMWNSYPDPSPYVVPTGMFYLGSMIVADYMPLWRLKKITGDGWMPENYSRIKQQEHDNKQVKTKDVQLVRYFGDLNISRSDEDIYLPNVEVIVGNGVLVYFKESDFPYPPVIFDGYERQDIRDPYYTSPIIKQSPMQKITTVAANKYIDALALKVEPPIEYDGNDPDYVMNGGPTIAPQAKTPTKSMGSGMKVLDIGDPRFALDGFTMGLRQMQEGLGVSSLRQGVPNSDRQTATEVVKISQGAEVRTVDFVSKLEQRGLRPFLYMQHDMNRRMLENYPFYNEDMSTSDFLRLSKKEVDFVAHFDIVGSRGVLGEEQRTQRVMQTTAFFSGNPLFAGKLKITEIMVDAYKDAGKKNPEEFVQIEAPKIPPEVAQKLQQAQQIIQQLQGALQQAQNDMRSEQAKHQMALQENKQSFDLDMKKIEEQEQTKRQTIALDHRRKVREIQLKYRESIAEIRAKLQADKEMSERDDVKETIRLLNDLENRSDAEE